MEPVALGNFFITQGPMGGVAGFLFFLYWNERKAKEKLTDDIIALYKSLAEKASNHD